MSASNPQISNNSPNLFINEIQDVYVRKNFQVLRDYFTAQNQLLNFQFAEISFTEAKSGFSLAHTLNCIVQDIVLMRITGTGKVSFLYDKFTTSAVIMDVDGPCRIRFLYGTYWNFTSSLNNQSGDKMVVSSGA